ncbi:tyrosine-protein phosphatase [Jiella sp. M17.18]|uniref:fused DSP-PTPase phosphatase/NAD kinase-like protein n=1 Tax=Jiella sp. M17.18 TaxID=3234247 RepID=UPI0034DE3027
MRLLRWTAISVVTLVLLAAGTLGGYSGYLHLVGNIHVVEPGELYRSATLPTERLDRLMAEKGIRTIVNLRGGNGDAWWKAERAVAEKHGADFVSFHLSADRQPTPETMRQLAFILKNAPKPILVHCKAGADRAGLASAIYELAVDGDPAVDADKQLSFRYGHFPWLGSKTGAMDRAFDAFDQDYAARQAGESTAVASADDPQKAR